MKRATFHRPCVKIEIRCTFCSWVNDFLCTQIVLKITITWFNSTFWMTFFGPAIRTKIWKKFFVQSVLEALRKEQRSRDTFLLSHWIDYRLPSERWSDKKYEQCVSTKALCKHGFPSLSCSPQTHQIHSKCEHFIKFKTLNRWAHNRCCSLKGVWMRSQTIQTILWTWN